MLVGEPVRQGLYGKDRHPVDFTYPWYGAPLVPIEGVGREDGHLYIVFRERGAQPEDDARNSAVCPGGWKVWGHVKDVQSGRSRGLFG